MKMRQISIKCILGWKAGGAGNWVDWGRSGDEAVKMTRTGGGENIFIMLKGTVHVNLVICPIHSGGL